MRKHDHHHCECKHERLAFCQKCKVPHCLDCGMEWVPRYTTTYYPNYYSYGTLCGTTSVTSAPVLTSDTLTACTHTS